MPAGITRLDAGPRFSEAAVHAGVAYLAGQVPADDCLASFDAQARSVFAQVDALLARVGSSHAHLLSAQVFLTDVADVPAMNAAYEAWLADAPGQAPPRATVCAVQLVRPEWRIEVVVTAAVPAAAPQ